MRTIYEFASSVTRGLFAFAGDKPGISLPEKHGPWVLKGQVSAGKTIPHKLDRATVEEAIERQGYQLWRMKTPG